MNTHLPPRSELMARRVMLLIVIAPLVLAAAMVFLSSLASAR